MNDITYLYNNPNQILASNMIKLFDEHKHSIVEKYTLMIGSNDMLTKLFIVFLHYYDSMLSNNKYHCAIDFEFNKNNIALMQLCFKFDKYKYIWIIDPTMCDSKDIDIVNDKLLLNKKVYKILHGSESLDIPYMYHSLFNDDVGKIVKFMKRMFDTRFLCEYVRSCSGLMGRCSMYDAMLFFDVISQDKYDKLNEGCKKMGKIYTITWSIGNLSNVQIKYAYYDVIYLSKILNNIYGKIQNDCVDYVRTHYYLVDIIRFVIMEKKKVAYDVSNVKILIDKMNNYMIDVNNKCVMLCDMYKLVMNNCVLHDDKGYIYVEYITKSDYIRGTMCTIFRYIVYSCIIKLEIPMYMKKNVVVNVDLDHGLINIKEFKKIDNLLTLFNEYVNTYLHYSFSEINDHIIT